MLFSILFRNVEEYMKTRPKEILNDYYEFFKPQMKFYTFLCWVIFTCIALTISYYIFAIDVTLWNDFVDMEKDFGIKNFFKIEVFFFDKCNIIGITALSFLVCGLSVYAVTSIDVQDSFRINNSEEDELLINKLHEALPDEHINTLITCCFLMKDEMGNGFYNLENILPNELSTLIDYLKSIGNMTPLDDMKETLKPIMDNIISEIVVIVANLILLRSFDEETEKQIITQISITTLTVTILSISISFVILFRIIEFVPYMKGYPRITVASILLREVRNIYTILEKCDRYGLIKFGTDEERYFTLNNVKFNFSEIGIIHQKRKKEEVRC